MAQDEGLHIASNDFAENTNVRPLDIIDINKMDLGWLQVIGCDKLMRVMYVDEYASCFVFCTVDTIHGEGFGIAKSLYDKTWRIWRTKPSMQEYLKYPWLPM